MPIYEFTCRGCQEGFELLVRSNENLACPSCGGGELEKQLSVPAAHSAARADLPVCTPPGPGGCGMPQCGTGSCQM